MSSLPTFDVFSRDVHGGRSPFPWQSALAERVLATGWPDLLDLPTGSGKTSTLDIGLWALAVAPDRMPRRIVLVVDRRIVVDQASDHARALLAALVDPPSDAVRQVADALRALWNAPAGEPPIAVATMRGGMPRDNDWARRPDQPMLGVSTVDQVGSRVLFRGYGVSPRSASIHAGLLGNDTLFLLDEVHLAEPFAQTLDAIRGRMRRCPGDLPDRFGVVRMSATAGGNMKDREVFTLSDADRRHPVLSRRLAASKRATLASVKVSGEDETPKLAAVARAAVQEALDFLRGGAGTVGVVVNRVDTALCARDLLDEHAAECDAILLTGRMRPIDRDQIVRHQLLPRCGPRESRAAQARPLVVVATQCIEAGADLDFDALVTECASLDALRQRFGRLDRQGTLGTTRAVILGRSDQVVAVADDPVYGRALSGTWNWLRGVDAEGRLDLGIDALPFPSAADGGPRSDLLAPRPDAPVLLPGHLDAWAQTSPVPDFEPDIGLYLHGPTRAASEVQIVWRSGLDWPTSDGTDRDRHLAESARRLAANRPSSLESISVPLGSARAWLAGDGTIPVADVIGVSSEAAGSDRRMRSDAPTPSRHALRWRGEESSWAEADDLRPGDVLVVPVEAGGIRHGSFAPVATEVVSDLGILAALRGRAVIVLRPDPPALGPLGVTEEAIHRLPFPSEESPANLLRDQVRDWASKLPERLSPGAPIHPSEWKAFVSALRGRRSGRQMRIGAGVVLELPAERSLLRGEVEDAVTEDDSSSFVAREVTLRVHSEDVRTLARQFAVRVGFAAAVVEDVALAAWLHDIGKADPRFQRWLVGGSEIRAAMAAEPLAKSALGASSRGEREEARRRAGYPIGYRHELLSIVMADGSSSALAAAHDRDLVLHLIGSHHGFCRPFAPFADFADDETVVLDHGGDRFEGRTRHRLGRLDSGVAARFWRLVARYGWWGLAWIEAVVRLADHRASEQREVLA